MERRTVLVLLAIACAIFYGAADVSAAPVSAPLKAAIGAAKAPSVPSSEKSMRVVFETTTALRTTADIEAAGGTVLRSGNGLVAACLPVSTIEAVSAVAGGVTAVRLPHRMVPFGVVDEGVALMQAPRVHSAGFTGAGVRVAIIDVGFKGLAAAQANGDLPPALMTHDYTGRGIETQYKHGTACAEVVYEMAPDAELHLLKVSDEIDMYDALDYCAANGIDIASISLGCYGSGPGNGTGPVAAACDAARANGILVVAAAGNNGTTESADGIAVGTHWEGVFIDSWQNDWWASGTNDLNQFIAGDTESYYNAVVGFPYQDDDGNAETNDVTIVLRWDDWPVSAVDYDIYLINYTTGAVVASSTESQTGSQAPVEMITVDIPDSEDYAHVYALCITKKSGEPAGKAIEVYLAGKCCFVPFYKYTAPIATSVSSLAEPADAASVVTVGAIDYHDWAIGPQEDFSSQGPTNAWAGTPARTKPDLAAPDAVSTFAYGAEPFYGTSASTPHVAGAAALIASMQPGIGPDDLQATLESDAIDMGAAGKDTSYGSGRLEVDVSTAQTAPILAAAIDGNSADDLVIDFGAANGIWLRRDNGTWNRVHASSAETMARCDVDADGLDELAIDFGAGCGVWLRETDGSWSPVHAASPVSITAGDINGNGRDDLVIDFGPGCGLWVRSADGAWKKLQDASPASVAVGDINGGGRDDLIIDFGPGCGLWAWVDDASWQPLHDASADAVTPGDIDGNGIDDLIIDFGAIGGLWVRHDDGRWTEINAADPARVVSGDLDNDARDEIIVDFGPGYGAWIRNDDGAWSCLNTASPENIVTADLDGNGADDIVCDFGPGNGVWVRYDSGVWSRIHSVSP